MRSAGELRHSARDGSRRTSPGKRAGLTPTYGQSWSKFRMHLRATNAGAAVENGVLIVGFADESQPERPYVMLQGGVEESEQDRRLGIGVYMEIDDQIRGGYGFTRGFSLDGKRLRIYVKPNAYKKLSVSGDVIIDITDPNADLPKLKEALELIYRGSATE